MGMFSNDLVLQLLNYLDFNLYKKITMDELSNTFHYNKDYIMRVFKKEIHMTIIDYINKKRIFLSLDSFKHNTSVLGIALSYGFVSLEYYSEMFHKVMGISPSTYRLFLSSSNRISEEDVYVIQDHIAELNSAFKRIENYKRNLPSTNPVKVLSIFK